MFSNDLLLKDRVPQTLTTPRNPRTETLLGERRVKVEADTTNRIL